MTHESAHPAQSPHELLAGVRDLTRQVRVAQRGTWFPLLVFAAITLAAIPVHRFAPHAPILGECRTALDGTIVCSGANPSVFAYWTIALVLAYTVIAGFYVRQARRRGVGTRIRPYIVAGIALAVTMSSTWLWLAYHPVISFEADAAGATPPITWTPVFLLASPGAAIALALLVLSWVERNRALLAFTLAYLVITVVQGGHVIRSSSQWWFLPYLLVPAAVLLLGGIGFALLRPTVEPDPTAEPQS